MENHPIPQDVTGFKFRIIGPVTIKQFLYILAAGALCGLFFIMPISFIIKWPIIFLLASIGAALAFLPIEGRPMDIMLMNFLKTIPAENKFIFHKKGAEALIHDFFTLDKTKKPTTPKPAPKDDRKKLLLNQLIRRPTSYKVDAQEGEKINDIKEMFEDSQSPASDMTTLSPATDSDPSPNEVVKPINTQPPVQADTYSDPSPQAQPPPKAKADEKKTTDNDISSIKPKIAVEKPADAPAKPVESPPQPATNTQIPGTPAVSVAPEDQVASGFPQIPDTPNVVLGIVKDARGKVLPNIIVEVLDETGGPVRAFKTNALGQFSSATPLSKGHYKIIFEDTRHIHEFSPIDIEMKNEIFQPLEIISTDQREKLRQELFGSVSNT